MKILWVNSNFLHPTTKGGQIRTLEMLRHMHRRHEIHYAAFENPAEPEGPARAGEYCTRAYPIRFQAHNKRSLSFLFELAAGLVSPMPVAISRHYSRAMARLLAGDLLRQGFDKVVCDFLSPAPHFPRLENVILFQHNVESMIWRRRVEQAGDSLRRFYLQLQARRMFAYEKQVCRRCGFVLAVSDIDSKLMREMFGVTRVASVPTGVDTEYFTPPANPEPVADLVFVGSMDWAPNVDGVQWFIEEILPLIRAVRPELRFLVVGRSPDARMQALARENPGVQFTGTVPDVRPYLWGATASVVPLRIGGGTRLKIYESMAAKVPVVSTTIGAEGLPVRHQEHFLAADDPQSFAQACLRYLDDELYRRRIAETARQYVSASFSWDSVARQFEKLLDQAPSWKPLTEGP
jgi:glycosyltransferase involved in cell wall biosynthesis